MTDANTQDWVAAHKKYTTFSELTLTSVTFAIAFAVITLVTFTFAAFAMAPMLAASPTLALTLVFGVAIAPLNKATQKAFTARQNIDAKMVRAYYGR